MTIADAGVVDNLGIEKGTGRIILTVLDDLDWSEETEHLMLLQGKLNKYLAFIESGEVFDQLQERLGLCSAPETAIGIEILAKYTPSEQGQAFLSYAQNMITRAGFSLSHKVLSA